MHASLQDQCICPGRYHRNMTSICTEVVVIRTHVGPPLTCVHACIHVDNIM